MPRLEPGGSGFGRCVASVNARALRSGTRCSALPPKFQNQEQHNPERLLLAEPPARLWAHDVRQGLES